MIPNILKVGGRDIDKWIANFLLPNIEQTNYLLNASEKLKCNLSDIEISDTKVLTEYLSNHEGEGEKIGELRLSRIELEDLLKRKGLFKTFKLLS